MALDLAPECVSSPPLALDERGVASLDGQWELIPGDHDPARLDKGEALPVTVPGLWEPQGLLELDGHAWYRTRFALHDPAGSWTLRFGAVMDIADVYLNGTLLGSHDSPFTPFELDAAPALRAGENELSVRVFDPAADDPEHLLLPHGKQGWANDVFPSRPSLYLTYGGIWQTVTLRRHGPVVVRDLFVLPDPDDVRIVVETERRPEAGDDPVELLVRALGRVIWWTGRQTEEIRRHELTLGATAARRWSPDHPALHRATVDLLVGGVPSDAREARFGLRTISVERDRILLNGSPLRMKAALVQGFSATRLYAEDDPDAIREEVLLAKRMGFNTLRLHIKAFDPAYLDVCDEVGMLAYCDVPVAEPVAHDQLDEGTVVAARAVRAATEQVRRDRNHPSVLLWSAMNELCLDRPDVRASDAYERFARLLAGAVRDADPTRPIVENDWIEPDPERVFTTPILTAHWYGRLHAEYLEELEAKCDALAGLERPILVTEYGDWGLPSMPAQEQPPFWDPRELYAAALAGSSWPGTIEEFVNETHRYQGLSNRLQTEIFRRHAHIGGYCLTELTDVPHELNGLLDIYRRPKPRSVREATIANQTVLPMLELDSLVVWAGAPVRARLHVANDGEPLEGCVAHVFFRGGRELLTLAELLRLDARELPLEQALARFDVSVAGLRLDRLPGYRPTDAGEVQVHAPTVPGSHDLVVCLVAADGSTVAENRYPIHVVTRRGDPPPVELLGSGQTRQAIEAVGARIGAAGPIVVAEGQLDATMRDPIAAALAAGRVVLVLAQAPGTESALPLPVRLTAVETAWGSSVFHFTVGHPALESLPRQSLLVAEESTVQAHAVVTEVDGTAFPATPVVIAYKPLPGALTGTVVGEHRVGRGRLLLCQYRLCERASRGDAAAQALLADLLHWAAAPVRAPVEERLEDRNGTIRLYRERGL